MQHFNADGSKKGDVVHVGVSQYSLGAKITSINDQGDYIVSWTAGNGSSAEVTAYTQKFY